MNFPNKFARSRRVAEWALASASVAALSLPAVAAAQTDSDTNATNAVVSEDIIVTARRENERLQDVPVSITAITSQTLGELGVTRGEEIAKLAPGLNLSNQTTAGVSGTSITLRGVRWTSSAGTPAIPVYFNEGAISPQTGLLSLYDIQQVEVLRGPQGTSRGAASISGAITVTSRRPDLDEIGGSFMGIVGTRDHQTFQGGVGVPIIPGKLAVRVAGNYENTEGNSVRSINSSVDPQMRVRSFRFSVRAEPTDYFRVNAMYERLTVKGETFKNVVGSGSPGNPAAGIAVGYNGPTIAAADFLSLQDVPNRHDERHSVFTVNAELDLFNHRLSYNFARDSTSTFDFASVDPGNSLVGFDTNSSQIQRGAFLEQHELRLSSIRGGHLVDYDIGYYNFKSRGATDFALPQYLPGAFGFTPVAGTQPLARYTLQTLVQPLVVRNDESFYANVELHLPYDIEVTGGIRRIKSVSPFSAALTLYPGTFVNIGPNPLGGFGLPCEALGAFNPAAGGTVTSPVYPGTCDTPVPGSAAAPQLFPNKANATIYNASVSKKFGPDLLAYATVGSSFRIGLPAVFNTGLPAAFLNPDPEKATSYELGLKATIAPRTNLNLSIYQIDYKGQLTSFQGIQYYNSIGRSISSTNNAFFRNVDARVRGIEAEFTTKPIDGLTLGALASYSIIKTKGSSVIPCNDPTRPITAANPINTCVGVSGQKINPSAPFQANLFAGYEAPISGSIGGFIRINVNFQGSSPNYGISTQKAKSYALVDLFAGLIGNEAGWELSGYAKNLFNVRKELLRLPIDPSYVIFGPTGYNQVNVTQPREIGVQLRYRFGSQ